MQLAERVAAQGFYDSDPIMGVLIGPDAVAECGGLHRKMLLTALVLLCANPGLQNALSKLKR